MKLVPIIFTYINPVLIHWIPKQMQERLATIVFLCAQEEEQGWMSIYLVSATDIQVTIESVAEYASLGFRARVRAENRFGHGQLF